MQPDFCFSVQEDDGTLLLLPVQDPSSDAPQEPKACPVIEVTLTPELARQSCILAAIQPLGGMVTRGSVQSGNRVTLRLPPTITAGKAVFLVLRATDLITARQSKPYKLQL